MLDAIYSFFDFIAWFIQDGIIELTESFFVWIVKWVIIIWIKLKIAAVTFSWELASALLIEFNLAQEINNALSILPSDALNALNFFRIPEGLSIILQAFTTKFILKFFGHL